MISRWLVRLNNRVTRWRRIRVAPGELLLLLPHCLQAPGCAADVVAGVKNCRGCGRCPYHELKPLAERLGIRIMAAAGGRQAVSAVRAPEVRAVVSVACARELAAGILMVLPKPVLAVENRQPLGPCRGTVVEVSAVEAAIRELLRNSQTEEAG